VNRCPRCGESVAATYVVCHGCGYLPASPDEFKLQPAAERSSPATIPSEVLHDIEDGTVKIKEPVTIEPDWFTEYVLPWILIAIGIGPNIYLSVMIAGALGPAMVALDIALLLFVQIPLGVAILMIVGTLFGINFGWLTTGIVKLAAIGIFVRGLGALAYVLMFAGFPAPAIGLALMAIVSQVWLLKSLFELDVFETIVCVIALGLTLSLLQYLISLLIVTLLRQADLAAILL
jgi:hypothetical protein